MEIGGGMNPGLPEASSNYPLLHDRLLMVIGAVQERRLIKANRVEVALTLQ